MEQYTPKPNKGALFSRGYDRDDPSLHHYDGYLDVNGTRFNLSTEVHIGAGSSELTMTATREGGADSPFDDSSLLITLMRTESKRNMRAPDFAGSFTLGAVDYALAGWLQTSQSGRRYLSLRVRSAEPERWVADDTRDDPLFR